MSRSQVLWLSGLFLLMLLLGIVRNMPVQQAFRFIQLPSNVGLTGLKGSITQGKLDLLVIEGVEFKEVQYQLSPLCFFKVAACYSLEDSDQNQINISRSLLSNTVNISDSVLKVSDDLIAKIPNMLIKPSGEIQLQIDRVEITGNKLTDTQLELHWEKIGIEGEDQVLGDIAIEILQGEQGFRAEIKESSGLIEATGEGTLEWNGRYEIDVRLSVDANLKPSIKSAIELVAARENLNKYTIRQQGMSNAPTKRQLSGLQPHK